MRFSVKGSEADRQELREKLHYFGLTDTSPERIEDDAVFRGLVSTVFEEAGRLDEPTMERVASRIHNQVAAMSRDRVLRGLMSMLRFLVKGPCDNSKWGRRWPS